MSWQATPYVLVLFLAGISSASLAAYGLHRYRRNGARNDVAAFVVLGAAVALWSVLYGVQLASAELETKLFAYKLLHIGGVLVPVAWAVFALEYTDRPKFVTAKTVLGLCVIPGVFLSVLLTNPYSLVLTEVWLETVDQREVLVTGNGPLYMLHLAYSYVLVLLGSYLIATYAIQSATQVRRQSLLLATGALIPLVLNVLNVFSVPPLGTFGVNLTPVSLAVSTGLFGAAIFRYRLLDLEPIARTAVFESMKEGVIVLDSRERIVDHNPAAGELYTDTELRIGASINEVMPQYEALEQRSTTAITLDGTERQAERVVRVMRTRLTSSGTTEGWVLLLNDVTEQERQRRKLERQNERLDRFASTISHDIRNYLTIMSGHADLAQATGEAKHFETIKRTIGRMDEFLEELLVLAKQGETIQDRERVELADVLEDVLEELQEDRLTVEMEENITVYADHERLRQALSNLLRNAVDHSDGNVTVRIGERPGGFYVADDGPGIDQTVLGRVFEPGFTTSDAGTGFGLAIVTEIVTAHGWEISAGNGENGGARFEIVTD